MQAKAARWRLPAALALSLLALLVVLVGARGGLSVVLIGAFMLAVPGLLLAEVLRVGDALLTLVLAMMAGPVLWVVLPTAEVFAGVWHPEVTVGVVIPAVKVIEAKEGPTRWSPSALSAVAMVSVSFLLRQ